MTRFKPFLPLIAFFVLIGSFGAAMFFVNPNELDSQLIDKPFPAFELSELDDPNAKVNESRLLGEISLVNVFGSWCVACVQEHPSLVAIGNMNRVKLVGMNWRDKRDRGRAWLNKYGDPYDYIIFDEISELAVALGVTGAPETYLVDQQGMIRYKHVGIITRDVWEKDFLPRIEKLEAGI